MVFHPLSLPSYRLYRFNASAGSKVTLASQPFVPGLFPGWQWSEKFSTVHHGHSHLVHRPLKHRID